MYVPRLLQRISMGSFFLYILSSFFSKLLPKSIRAQLECTIWYDVQNTKTIIWTNNENWRKKSVLDCDAITLSGNRNVCLFSNRIAFFLFSCRNKSTQNEGFKCTVILHVLFLFTFFLFVVNCCCCCFCCYYPRRFVSDKCAPGIYGRVEKHSIPAHNNRPKQILLLPRNQNDEKTSVGWWFFSIQFFFFFNGRICWISIWLHLRFPIAFKS